MPIGFFNRLDVHTECFLLARAWYPCWDPFRDSPQSSCQVLIHDGQGSRGNAMNVTFCPVFASSAMYECHLDFVCPECSDTHAEELLLLPRPRS